MTTNVPHRLSTPQAHAIAGLTGYEDVDTLRWQQVCMPAALQAQTTARTTGQCPPVAHTPEAACRAARCAHAPRWCHTHQGPMPWHHGNARGPGWGRYPRLDDPSCPGGGHRLSAGHS